MSMNADLKPSSVPFSGFDVLHQDAHLVAINKPEGWLVHRSALSKGERRFVLQRLRDQLGQTLWPVHRLDRGTSGVLVFAFTPDVARLISAQWASGEGVHKTYRAIVRGWPQDAQWIDQPLKRMPDDMRPERVEMQSAQTQLQTLRRGGLAIAQDPYPSLRWAEVALQPFTGRRHQLRRHMKHIAHPIFGDATHGKGPLNRAVAAHLGVHRLWLHASTLAMHHPITGAPLHLEAPLGQEWARWAELNTPATAITAP